MNLETNHNLHLHKVNQWPKIYKIQTAALDKINCPNFKIHVVNKLKL